MKKIGIFTFFQLNYGAVLQAYALQHYLEQQPSVKVEIVDFTTPNHLSEHKVFNKQKTHNFIKIVMYFCLTLVHSCQIKRRISLTWEFKKKYFNFTRRFSSLDDVMKNHPVEDVYITGSDQVFNPKASYVPLYYLGFEKGKGIKAAYAPSFGISEFNREITSKIKKYVDDFDYLSCREPAGSSYLESITGKRAPVVIDPVFLLDAEEWRKVLVKPNFRKDYIFIYDLNGGDNLIKIAKNIQKTTKLPIVCLTGNRMKVYPVNKQFYDAGPAEFIGWIQNASYVVTDSFHGTAFSLIFAKQFFSFIALEKTSSRIKNILSEAGLLDRIIDRDSVQYFNFENYNTIKDVKLDGFISSSKHYIKEILS